MTVATYTYSYTITQTATYLSEMIMGEISNLFAQLGITPNNAARWKLDESAIAAWIEEGSLDTVVLECRRPDGTVRPIFEFPITYRSSADGTFENSRAAIARARTKISSVPRGTTYRLFCTFRFPSSDQPGWFAGTRASTDGLRSTSFGVLADAPHARADLRRWS
jgi:hypothetical protein